MNSFVNISSTQSDRVDIASGDYMAAINHQKERDDAVFVDHNHLM